MVKQFLAFVRLQQSAKIANCHYFLQYVRVKRSKQRATNFLLLR
jgi:hypothetical protein